MALDWPAFAAALWKVNDELGIKPEWALAVIHLETAGTFDPSIVNPGGCVGINQMCASTYPRYVHVPVSSYRAWPASAQLAGPVFDYWRDALRSGPINSAGRLMAAQLGHSLLPLATSPDSVLLSSPSAEYAANASFDTAGKGYITLRDLENAVGAHERSPAVQAAVQQAYALRYWRPAPRGIAGAVLAMVALAGAAGYGAYRLLPRRSRA